MRQRVTTTNETSRLQKWIFFFIGIPISVGVTLVFGKNYALFGLILSFVVSIGFLSWKKRFSRRVCASGGNVIFFGIINFLERSFIEALPDEGLIDSI